MRYLIYARVSPKGSTWAGGETSVPDQIAACKAYASARDPAATFEVVQDVLQSGASDRRPGYAAILDQLRAGAAAWDALLVRHLDRLSRSLTGALDLLRLLQANGKGLVSTTQNVDLSTATGRAMLGIILVFAEWERAMNSERTKAKMLAIVEAGGWPVGNPPVGYRRPGPRQNILEPDPAKAPVVQAVYRDYLAGLPPDELVRRHHVPRATVFWMLHNPAYVGRIPYGGREYPGGHKPIVSRADWDRVQARLPGGVPGAPVPGRQTRPYLLAGLVRCSCGSAMSPYSSKGRGGVRYHYYRCIGCRSGFRADELEGAVLDALGSVRLAPEAVDRVVADIQRQRARALAKATPDLGRLSKRLEQLGRDLQKLEQAMLDGLVTAANRDWWNDKVAAVRAAIADATTRREHLTEAVDSPDSPYARAEAAARRLPTLAEGLATADMDARRQVVAEVVEEIRRTADGWEIRLRTGENLSSRLVSASEVATRLGLILTVRWPPGRARAVLRVA